MIKISKMSSQNPEIFHSIQGEGVNSGEPSYFIRLSTCNLACVWCDTKYTWDFKQFDYNDHVIELTDKEILSCIDSSFCNHVVITGGEPLLQQKELISLASEINRQGFFCELETNGTIEPDPLLTPYISQWNVSPKLSNSGNKIMSREVPLAYKSFANMHNSYFKFVVSYPKDIEEILALSLKYDLDRDKILLMPEGVTKDQILDRSIWLVDLCTKFGFRYSPRLHILLWGNVQGM